MSFEDKLRRAHAALPGRHLARDTSYPAATLFFSVSDGDSRAIVAHASGPSIESAWQQGLLKIRSAMRESGLRGAWLRIDWVDRIETTTWRSLRTLLEQVKRNYFRYGIALDPNFTAAFLEQELNANAMLYGGNAVEHAVVNERNFTLYAGRRFADLPPPDFSDEREIAVFSTRGVFCDDDGLHAIGESDGNVGYRRIDRLSDGIVSELVATSSSYLAKQVQPDGTFVYGYHPCFDRRINAYNALRHASTTYAMIEAWTVTHDAKLMASIERSLAHLTQKLVRGVTLPDGTNAAFLVDIGDEIKLGGNAVTILALTKYCAATSTTAFLPLLEQLALGIRFMQDPASGAFVHVLNFPDLSVKEKFRTIYYDGEAAFGLMRLYSLTKDPRWLKVVEDGLEHFIAAEHWKHHDHWLSYCVNELTRYRPHEKYFRFGIRNVSNYLDFVASRVTTFPTLLELMMAAREMLARIDDMPEFRHLLGELDLVKFKDALEFRAHYLLNGYFWPEMAMYFRNPARIVGAFFIRHHAFRVRIDDVEHYLSGFVAYRKYLEVRSDFERLIARHAAPTGKNPEPSETIPASVNVAQPWSAPDLERATHGKWLVPPPPGWSAGGLCIYAPTLRPGDMVAVRPNGGDKGVPWRAMQRLRSTPAGLIVSEAGQSPIAGIPVLQVADVSEAILDMGRYARARMTGKILAVTGSAGKSTTVAMLAHALAPWGSVAKSAPNANLSHGVAWNLASMAPDTAQIVLELAIGRMARTARLARPHIAIVTNILPAHLDENSTIRDVALTKSAIFRGMSPGSIAVLNRDMLEWETVQDAARNAKLEIVRYGTTSDCEFRLLDYEANGQLVTADIKGWTIRYRIGAAGSHMAMNSLAVLAVASALGHDLEPALAQIETFSALSGRGEKVQLTVDGRRLTIIDDSYNANPGSMRAALDNLAGETGRRRVAVLGQMAELGPQGPDFHAELAETIDKGEIDRVYVMGELYGGLWEKLSVSRKGRYATSLEELKTALRKDFTDGDVVLFKGSHSTNIHHLVDWIKQTAAPGASGAVADTGPARVKLPAGTSALLYDGNADAIVFASEAASPHPPASITKLLTLCLIAERLGETAATGEETVEISAGAANIDSRWGFAAGERVDIGTLMQASAIVSSNEAAHALAEWHSGSTETFTRQLNRRAAELGMDDTLFSSPSGLGRQQKMTLRDALVLARHVLSRHASVAALCAKPYFEWQGKRHASTNRLLDIPGADGLKTGTLRGRGNHIIFSALQGDRRWIAIVLGAPTKKDRDDVVRALMRAYAS